MRGQNKTKISEFRFDFGHKDIGPVLWRQDGIRAARVSRQLAPASVAREMRKPRSSRETSGYARLPGYPAVTLASGIQRLAAIAGRRIGLQFSKSSDGGWSKHLNHRGSTLAFFTPFPCASLRYVADCLVCGPRLLCIPAMAQRASLSAGNDGVTESVGNWACNRECHWMGCNLGGRTCEFL